MDGPASPHPTNNTRRSSSVIVPVKAAKLVADELKERILSGDYVPGDFLPPVEELLAEFGVSRPTIREALNLLEGGGLVRLRRGPGGGAEVRAPDDGEVIRTMDALFRFEHTTAAHLMEVRLVLEPQAARLAALRGTDEEFAKLEQSVERQARREVLNSNHRWFNENLEFHSQIAAMSRNPVVRVLTSSLRELIRHVGEEAHYSPDDRARSVEQHRAILDRLRARDAKGAEEEQRRHLLESIYVRKHMVEPAEWDGSKTRGGRDGG